MFQFGTAFLMVIIFQKYLLKNTKYLLFLIIFIFFFFCFRFYRVLQVPVTESVFVPYRNILFYEHSDDLEIYKNILDKQVK